MNSLIRRLLEQSPGGSDVRLSYDEASALARHEDPDVRRKLAEHPDTVPEILYYLAEDPDPRVRRAIIANTQTPPLAHLLLVNDSDADVRGDLAGAIARLAPGLTEHEQDRVRHSTMEALRALARDQIPRVRQVLSEALKDVANAPPSVIRQLALDVEVAVATPVLEFSPVLTDEDLLEIIAASPVSAKLSAISRRRRVTEAVSDAIAETEDDAAITALLGNASAQIREETLDRLIEQAPDHPGWQEPLVRRPSLSTGAAVRLARYVADNLILVLQSRADLPPETARAVARVVHRRLGEPRADGAREARRPDGQAPAAVTWRRPSEQATERARFMAEHDTLTEKVVADAIVAVDEDFVTAALAELGGLSPLVVSAILRSGSPEGIVAVAWKANLSPSSAVHLQAQIGRIGPVSLLRPGFNGTFPMNKGEMLLQLDLFRQSVADSSASF
jgi:YD repeat-containing protein